VIVSVEESRALVPRGLGYVLALSVALVLSSRAGAQSAASGPADVAERQVQSLQQQMVGQPDLMEAVTELESDPDFQKVLDDPDIIDALQAGNYGALLTNPKVSGLTSNPKVQELTNKLSQ